MARSLEQRWRFLWRSLAAWLPMIGYGWVFVVFGVVSGLTGFLQDITSTGALWGVLLVRTPIPTSVLYLGSIVGMVGGSFNAFHRLRLQVSASVYVTQVTVEHFEVGASPWFLVHVYNDGPSIAKGVKVSVGVDHDDGSTSYEDPRVIDIPSKEARTVDIRMTDTLSRDVRSGLDAGSRYLKVLGYVAHGDHGEPYCFKYRAVGGGRPSGVSRFARCEENWKQNIGIKVRAGFVLGGSNVSARLVVLDEHGNVRGSAEPPVRPSAPDTEEPPRPPDE